MQKSSTEKYCDAVLMMSVSFRVMLVYFASKEQVTFPE
jgi:hypothetical protein